MVERSETYFFNLSAPAHKRTFCDFIRYSKNKTKKKTGSGQESNLQSIFAGQGPTMFLHSGLETKICVPMIKILDRYKI